MGAEQRRAPIPPRPLPALPLTLVPRERCVLALSSGLPNAFVCICPGSGGPRESRSRAPRRRSLRSCPSNPGSPELSAELRARPAGGGGAGAGTGTGPGAGGGAAGPGAVQGARGSPAAAGVRCCRRPPRHPPRCWISPPAAGRLHQQTRPWGGPAPTPTPKPQQVMPLGAARRAPGGDRGWKAQVGSKRGDWGGDAV